MSSNKYDSEWNKQYCKKWYIENKEKHLNYLKTPIVCNCGLTVLRSSLPKHKKSKKHLKIINLKK